MAFEAERTHIGKIALAASFSNGNHMVGVPELAPHAPFFFEPAAGSVIEFAFLFSQRFGIEAADRAHAAIACEDLLAEIAWIGAQPPLMHTSRAAEGKVAARDRAAAPAAGFLVRSFDPATGHGSELGVGDRSLWSRLRR
jgi:hypothetical protein